MQFLTDRAENFWQRLIIVRIKARKPIFDFRKKQYFSDFFKTFKVPLQGNSGVHSNGAQKHTTRSRYEPTSQVSSKSVDSSGLQSCPLHTNKHTNIHTYKHTNIQTDGKSENKGTLTTTQQAGRRHGWSVHNCILVIQFLTDRAEIFWQRGWL